MTQYCRYCAFMICGDFNYCEMRKACYPEDYIKRPNHCSQWELNEIDALSKNLNPYRPRERKAVPKGHQIDVWEGLKNEQRT